MENQRMSLDKLKSKLKTANVVANANSLKGGVLDNCHVPPPRPTNAVCGMS